MQKNRSVGLITHGAADPETARLAPSGVTKTYALNVTVNSSFYSNDLCPL